MSKNEQPNFLLILADDLGFSDIGCFGSEIQTPHLDGLGFSGVRLTQLYNCARCCPSRASILTGSSPHRAGIGHMVDDWNVGPAYQGWLREDTTTIAEALKPAGYRTLYSGKWHLNWSFEADPGQPADEHHRKLGTTGYPHPLQRGFDDVYAMMAGATSLFNPVHLLRQDSWVDPDQPGYYITDAITDEAIRMIEATDEQTPLFMHLSHIAPHWPLHALPEDIAKYRDTYKDGWDVIRKRRHARLQELGIIQRDWACSPRDEFAPEWSSLDPDRQAWESYRMAVYAAMVDRMDQSIGRVIKSLEQTNRLDNTIIVFLSDNGGSAEFLAEDGWCQWYGHPTWDGREMRLGNDPDLLPGPDDTFMSYDLPWANASNTPFRLFKHFVHEGGVATPAIVSWPRQMKTRHIAHEPCHVQDIMPTLLDAAGVEQPIAVQGESFLDLVMGHERTREHSICIEHEGNSAIRRGPWKAVRKKSESWELYNMDEDRTELNDLAAEHSTLLTQLIAEFDEWRTANEVRDWPPGQWPSWMQSSGLRGDST